MFDNARKKFQAQLPNDFDKVAKGVPVTRPNKSSQESFIHAILNCYLRFKRVRLSMVHTVTIDVANHHFKSSCISVKFTYILPP